MDDVNKYKCTKFSYKESVFFIYFFTHCVRIVTMKITLPTKYCIVILYCRPAMYDNEHVLSPCTRTCITSDSIHICWCRESVVGASETKNADSLVTRNVGMVGIR